MPEQGVGDRFRALETATSGHFKNFPFASTLQSPGVLRTSCPTSSALCMCQCFFGACTANAAVTAPGDRPCLCLLQRSFPWGISSETSDCRSLTFSQHTLTHTALTHPKGRSSSIGHACAPYIAAGVCRTEQANTSHLNCKITVQLCCD